MRKQGLIGLLVFALIVFAIMYLLSDMWIEAKAESAGSSVNGALVEIDNFDLSVFDMEVSWDRLQITNPNNTMKNKIETGKCAFDMEFIPLLSGKVIIEEFTISDVLTNTERETDGKIEKEEEDEEPGFIGTKINQLKDEVSAAPVFNMAGYAKKLNTDSILALLDLKTPANFEKLQSNISTQTTDWEQKIEALDFQKDLSALETEIKAIKTENLENLQQVQSTLDQVNTVKKSLSGLESELNNTKTDFSKSVGSVKSGVSSVDNWIKDDYKSAMSMAQLPDFDVQSIGKMLFGKELVDQVNTYLGYARQAREYSNKLKSTKPEDEDPPRLKGQDIYFYSENARPDFWIKRMVMNGKTASGISLSGTVKNVVSDQRLIGAMTDFRFEGSGENNSSLQFEGVLNYIEEIPAEVFKLSYTNFPLKNVQLADSRLVPAEIKSGIGTVNGTLDLKGETIQSEIEFVGRALNFDDSNKSSAGSKAEKMINELISQTDKINFKALIKGENDDLNFALRSNLDDLFSKNLKNLVGKEIEKARAEIKGKVDEKVGEYKAKAEQLAADYEQKVNAKIETYEKQLEEKKQLLEKKKKEIENEKKKIQDKVDKEKKKIEDKAKNKIKGLF